MLDNYQKLLEEFLNKSKFLDKGTALEIDNKHTRIVNNANNLIKNNKSYFLKNFRDWSDQNDLGSPMQITFLHFKKFGFFFLLTFFKKIILFWRYIHFNRSFYDDLKIIEYVNGSQFIKDNPVHLTPGVTNFYKIFGGTTNYRWNRYVYLSSRIMHHKLLNDGDTWVDIGSYYGGLQSFIKKKFPSNNFILVDFHHQLLRSFIFLKSLFPDSKHILPDDIKDKIDLTNIKNTFFYLPVNQFSMIDNLKVKLVTNFFSFGEMKKNNFEQYISSQLLQNSEKLYFVNRFVSSPFFERTYDDNINILDYLNKLKKHILYLDVFPMHHYQIINRKILGRYAYRPVSSPYFELILK
jgi:putative sugar O-methyltransferase